MYSKRSWGVIGIVIILIVVGAIGFIVGITNLANSNINNMYASLWVGYTVDLAVLLSESIGEVDIYTIQAVLGIIYISILILRDTIANLSVVWVGLILFIVYLPACIGLLSMRKWGWYLGLIAGITSIIVGLYVLTPIITPEKFFVFIILVTMGVGIIGYLFIGLKYAFGEISVESVIQDLKVGDSSVRSRAAKILGVRGEKSEVELLIQALNDSDLKVRQEAAVALGRLKDERALEPLIETLKDKSVRKFAWSAIISIIRTKMR